MGSETKMGSRFTNVLVAAAFRASNCCSAVLVLTVAVTVDFVIDWGGTGGAIGMGGGGGGWVVISSCWLLCCLWRLKFFFLFFHLKFWKQQNRKGTSL